MSERYVFASGKGGTGKSTTVVYIGISLADMGYKVLLVDMDIGLRCLDIMLGVAQNIVFDMGDMLMGRCAPEEAVISVEKIPNLYLLPAPANANDCKTENFFNVFEKALEFFDYVLIDSPAGIDFGFEVAVSLAQRAIIVTMPDKVCIADARRVAAALDKVLKMEKRLIINRIDPRLVRQGVCLDIDEIIDGSQIQLIGAVPYDRKLANSSLRGSLCLEDTAGIRAFDRIAQRITGANVPLRI